MGSLALGLPYAVCMEYGVTRDRKLSPLPTSEQLKQKRNCVKARNRQVRGVLQARLDPGLKGSASFRVGAISRQFGPASPAPPPSRPCRQPWQNQSFVLCLAVLESASELGLPG